MSTDISIHAEILYDGEWLYYGRLNVPQDYNLFSAMAGVRSEWTGYKRMFRDRGLPDDRSLMLELFVCEESGHDHSWITANEYIELCEWYNKTFDSMYAVNDIQGRNFRSGEILWLFGNYFTDFRRFPDDYPDWLDDYRIVFWFRS